MNKSINDIMNNFMDNMRSDKTTQMDESKYYRAPEAYDTTSDYVITKDTIPAVVFEGINVYTPNGTVGCIPAGTYNGIMNMMIANGKSINSAECNDSNIDIINNAYINNISGIINCTLQKFSYTLSNILYSSTYIINNDINNILSIDILYTDLIFGNNVSDIVDDSIRKGNIKSVISTYFSSNNKHENIGVLIDGITSATNTIMLNYYNNIRLRVNEFIVNKSDISVMNSQETIVDIYNMVDKNMFRTFTDIVYETSIFIRDIDKIVREVLPRISNISQ